MITITVIFLPEEAEKALSGRVFSCSNPVGQELMLPALGVLLPFLV